ncbi:MAG: hypothetical protein K9G46_08485 [Flavobacteriales bacterium]|jgi:hypothetical protein|nr:hypothetical protein [Flavobacteriales bacterium]
MDKESKQQELFSELGKFVAHFEGLQEIQKECICIYLEESGLTNDKLTKLLLSDSTAKSICDYFFSISADFLKNQPKTSLNPDEVDFIQKLLDKTRNAINDASQLRNDIVHSSWKITNIYDELRLEAERIKIRGSEGDIDQLEILLGDLSKTIEWIDNLALVSFDIATVLVGFGSISNLNDAEALLKNIAFQNFRSGLKKS